MSRTPTRDQMLRLLGDEDDQVRLDTVRILVASPDTWARSLLAQALEDRDQDFLVRRQALFALEDWRLGGWRDTLIDLINDPDWRLREEVALALGRVGDQDSRHRLETMASSDARRAVRSAARQALKG